jgi:outer membrane protein assembly factor BamB
MILGLVFFFFSGVIAAQPQWKGSITKEGGVTIVKNPKDPIYKDPILTLKEDFALGGPNATGDNSFNQIRTAAIGDDGTIYVLDGKESHVKMFDASGKYLKTFARKGQGPGELESPSAISINRTKKEIMIQEISRRLSYFAMDGRFLRNQSVKDVWALRARVDSQGNIVVQEGMLDPKDPRYLTKKFNADMKLIAELAKSPAPSPSVFNPLMAIAYWTIDKDDNIVYGYPKTYEIKFFGPSNAVVKKVMRDYDPVEITEAEKEEQRKGNPSDVMGGMKLEFERYHPAFRRFFLSDKGHIFVQTWEKTKDGLTVHDVFDADGRFLARLPLALTGIEIRNGKYYALEEDAEGYQMIKRYSVTWLVK